VLESFALTLPLARGGILCRELLKVIADYASKRGVAVHGDFTEFLDEILVERESDIHRPIIRETLKSCKCISLKKKHLLESSASRFKESYGAGT